MWVALLTLAPVGLVLALLTFGRYGRRPGVAPTRPRMALVGIASVVLGPVAVLQLGFFFWLLAIIALTTLLAMIAAWRGPRTPIGT